MRSGLPAGSLLAGLAAVLTVQVGCDGGSEGGDTSTAGVGSGGSGPEEPECLLPVDPGPCQESIQRYYYEPSAETCQQFTYGGCEGNENNFLSWTGCMSYCLHYLTCSCPDSATAPGCAVNRECEGCPEYTLAGLMPNNETPCGMVGLHCEVRETWCDCVGTGDGSAEWDCDAIVQ